VARDGEHRTLPTHIADSERIKRRHFLFLKNAQPQSEDSVDAMAKGPVRFETDTRYRDLKAFHVEPRSGGALHLLDCMPGLA
jgi:integrase/recombinase XerD